MKRVDSMLWPIVAMAQFAVIIVMWVIPDRFSLNWSAIGAIGSAGAAIAAVLIAWTQRRDSSRTQVSRDAAQLAKALGVIDSVYVRLLPLTTSASENDRGVAASYDRQTGNEIIITLHSELLAIDIEAIARASKNANLHVRNATTHMTEAVADARRIKDRVTRREDWPSPSRVQIAVDELERARLELLTLLRQ